MDKAALRKEIREKKRAMTEERIDAFLKENNVGYLATLNPDGSPYCVPINYAWLDGKIVLHCAYEGQKTDNLAQNPKVAFTVYKCYEIRESEKSCSDWDVRYESVMIFGQAEFPEGEEKAKLLTDFTNSFLPPDKAVTLPEAGIRATNVIVIRPEHMTGKTSLNNA